MTNDKAIEEVKNYENYPNGLSKECRDYIIKALEQEPILDKIRAELIQSIQNGTIKIESGNEELFRILDKYKGKSEKATMSDIKKLIIETANRLGLTFRAYALMDADWIGYFDTLDEVLEYLRYISENR